MIRSNRDQALGTALSMAIALSFIHTTPSQASPVFPPYPHHGAAVPGERATPAASDFELPWYQARLPHRYTQLLGSDTTRAAGTAHFQAPWYRAAHEPRSPSTQHGSSRHGHIHP